MIRGTITGLSAAELRQLQLDVGLAQKVPDGRWGWQTSLIQRSPEAEVEGTTYRLDPHYSGLVVAVAGPAQGPQVHKRIAVPERGDVTVDFNFAGGLEVTGRVTRAGKPAADILMWALPDEGQPVAGFTQTTASGEYRFVDLAPGRYRISPANVKPVRLQMTGKVTQDFELPALEVAGRVADATTGQPLRSVRVELRTTQAEAETEYRSVLTDREGDFKLDLLAAGDYVLTLQRAGYDMTRQELTLRSSLESLTLPLRAAEGVRLRVHGPDLGNLSSAIITERVGAKVVAVVPVSLDLSATGKIPPSLTGRTFTIDAPGYEPFTVSTWDGNPLDVELRESKRQ
jgi:5-hydroxyisourate hydrolase-like protein (transthyretin family)